MAPTLELPKNCPSQHHAATSPGIQVWLGYMAPQFRGEGGGQHVCPCLLRAQIPRAGTRFGGVLALKKEQSSPGMHHVCSRWVIGVGQGVGQQTGPSDPFRASPPAIAGVPVRKSKTQVSRQSDEGARLERETSRRLDPDTADAYGHRCGS